MVADGAVEHSQRDRLARHPDRHSDLATSTRLIRHLCHGGAVSDSIEHGVGVSAQADASLGVGTRV